MAVTILLETQAKPGGGDELLAMFKAALPDTRAWEGCIGLKAYRDQDNPDSIILVEDFETKEAYQKYLSWRQETGVFDQLSAMLAAPPSIRYLDLTDA